jgi:hypothetical protein
MTPAERTQTALLEDELEQTWCEIRNLKAAIAEGDRT